MRPIIQRAVLAPLAALAALVCVTEAAHARPVSEVDIELLGRTTSPGGAAMTEVAAFDPASQRVFATNAENNTIDIYDLSDPAAPGGAIDSIDLDPYGGGVNSVAVSDGVVAAAVEGASAQAQGTVQFFDTDGGSLGSAPAGALPDMLTFTKRGSYLLVANEGEPAADGSVDPEGSVTVIDMRDGLDDLEVDQASLDGVKLRGPVRTFTPGSSLAEDLEPEYITSRGDTAYVAIQEANAVGVLDIRKARFEVVRSLGFKDWSESLLDTSNGDDGGISLRSWDNLFGMYQPDAIASYQLPAKKKGKKKLQTFVITANEGDARDYDFFSEEVVVGEDIMLDPGVFGPGVADPANLGELKVTSTMGDTDNDGDYDELYAFGGRSLSILNSKGSLVFDTGGELEELSSTLDAENFNKSNTEGSSVDNRSDDKGPEPEAIAVGKVGGTQYAFAAAERAGGIYAYDLEAKKGEARFADAYLNTREADLGPEGALFVRPKDSPTGEPLVLFTYEISSTIAAYSITAEP